MNGITGLLPRTNLCWCRTTHIVRHYAFKSDLQIKWNRPEKIPSYKPEVSGDLLNYPKLDRKQPMLEYRNVKQLENANENVKKLFSLEFSPKRETNRVYFNEMIGKVKRHQYDVTTVEATIARWTGVIRALQESMERFPRNKRIKVNLTELIDKRKKHLKYLRRWDYKRFEWLLETLDIVYKPYPTNYESVTRKRSLIKLTDKYCQGLRDQKLEAYRLALQNEQPAFLEEKIRSLKFIQSEQRDLNIPLTVTDKEIALVTKQLEELISRRETDTE